MTASAAQLLNINPPLTAQERATRSVFVGNIPYEATEEQLKEIFTQAGPVVSFRLVYDRETGKPKGYGFCEYLDLETAQSAMRNLNNHDFNGRPLRVGVAAGEQSKDDIKGMQQAVGGAPIESPYGDPIEPEKAPEAISKAVASLPPEQMFELMKQMKLCIQNNPTEARSMLLQNPQLAYALLQAQIVMKIVDPQVALAMLYRDPNQIPTSTPVSNGAAHVTPTSSSPMDISQSQGMIPPGVRGPAMMSAPPRMSGPGGDILPGPQGLMQGGPQGPIQGRPDLPGSFHGQSGPARADSRDPRLVADPRSIPRPGPSAVPIRGPGTPAHLAGPGPVPAAQLGVLGQLGNLGNLNALNQLGLTGGLQLSGIGGQVPSMPGGTQISAQDQEKAALIMQVLQLTDQQIAMLPPDQRQSILILKEQISQSGK